MGWIIDDNGEMAGLPNRKISSDERQAIARKITRRFAPEIEAARMVESGQTGFRNCAFCRKPIFVEPSEYCFACSRLIARRRQEADARAEREGLFSIFFFISLAAAASIYLIVCFF